jgi:CRP/FNR family transcriptional regulator, cyclic AMP receptor protein
MKKVLFILGELSDDDIDWLIKTGSRQEVPAGTVLIHEGQAVDTLYILLDGALVVSISALEGKQIARLSSGDVVGEMSFVDARPPSATVQTLEQSLVLAIPRPALAEKLQQDVGFASRFYRALAILLSSRLRGTVRQLGDSPQKPTDEPDQGLDMSASENVAIAEVRFDWLLRRLKSGEILEG